MAMTVKDECLKYFEELITAMYSNLDATFVQWLLPKLVSDIHLFIGKSTEQHVQQRFRTVIIATVITTTTTVITSTTMTSTAAKTTTTATQ